MSLQVDPLLLFNLFPYAHKLGPKLLFFLLALLTIELIFPKSLTSIVCLILKISKACAILLEKIRLRHHAVMQLHNIMNVLQ